MKRTNCFVNSAMLVGLALVNSAAWAQTGPFVYAANWGDVAGAGNISAYRAGTSGALVAVPGSPFLTGGNPASLTIEPTGRFVYVTSAYRTPGSVLAYAIDRSTGALSPVPGSPFTAGPRPFSVTVHPAGRFAYVMSTDSSNLITQISTFMIDRVTGALSQVSGSSLTLGTGSHSVAVDTTGRFAYVTSQFPDDVSGFTINNMTGPLTPVPGPPFRAGRGPGAVTVDPTGRFVYVANFDYFFRSGSLSAFTIDGRTGTLRPINGSPYGILAEPKSLTVDPTGRFAYLAAFDAVLGFTIDNVPGALTPVGGSPFGTRFYGPIRSTPTSITIDPTGHVAYVANFNSPTVSAFAINRSTRPLPPLPPPPFSPRPFPFLLPPTP